MNSPRFTLPPVIIAVACVSLAGLSPLTANPGKAVVTGKFLGDGKDAKIQHLVVETREPFSDKPAIQLVFTEKDPSKSKKPGLDAGFKKLGSALILSVFQDGDIFGCEVAHSAHEKAPFSSVGKIQIKDFKVADNQVSGQVTTGGELETFGQKWEVDLTFSAPLPKDAFAGEKKEAPPAQTEEAPEEPKGPKPSIAELPLPAGAADVDYNAVVEQLACRVDSPVSVVATEYAAKLTQQGWKEQPGSLVSKTNAILKRAKGGADLTIIIQPAGKGCTVKFFPKGFDWTKAPAAAPAKPAAPVGVDVDAIEDEANRLINDTLKQIPRRP